ncbi:alpha/beta-hydrolase [Rhizodiscina lignyota]|uniref:Alpha/beta-hydrolase n=1 Tax=Rhizodiscina lignyota TaxID=1504668 RepID=A0A9P4I880_9PEZI|nr:alpha/beta-hydrolase [Rhizodiscina lignyota]
MGDEVFAQPWLEFEKELGFRPLLHGPLDNVFAGWEKLGGALVSKFEFPAPDDSIQTEDRTIDDGLKVRIYTPKDHSGNKPFCFYTHGGGYAMGDLNMDDGGCRVLASAGIIVVSIDYRLAPQHKFPVALDDSMTGLHWAFKNAQSLGASPEKAIIAGASAGGQLALGVALRLIDEGKGDLLAGVIAQVPITLHPDAVPESLKAKFTSYDEHAEHTVNTKNAMAAFNGAYDPPPTHKYFSVLLHDKIDEMPKTYITCAGADTLRDDARAFRDALKQKGVPYKYDEYPGYPHYFWTFPAQSLKAPAAEYNKNLVDAVKWILS